MDDKLREDYNKSLSDDIIDLGEGIAAAGAGAISFYRLGGADLLSKRFNNYIGKTRAVLNKISGIPYNQVNYDSIGKTYEQVKDILNAPAQRTMNLNVHSPVLQSLARAGIHDIIGGSLDRQHSWTRGVTLPIQQYAHEVMKTIPGGPTRNMSNLMNNFIREVVPFTANNESAVNRFSIDKIIHRYSNNFQEQVLKNVAAFAIKRRTEYNYEVPFGKRRTVDAVINEKSLATLRDIYGYKGDNKKRLIDDALGDQIATIEDILSHQALLDDQSVKIPYSNGNKRGVFNLVDNIRKRVEDLRAAGKDEEAELLLNTYIDPYLRISNDGDLRSFYQFDKVGENLLNFVSNTLPGHFLKLKDLQLSKSAGTLVRFAQGSLAPDLASVEGSKSQYINNEYYRINDKTYKYLEDTQELEEVEALRNSFLISSRHGGAWRLYRGMAGMAPERERDPNSISSLLDLGGTTEERVDERVRAFFSEQKRDTQNYVPDIVRDIQENFAIDTDKDKLYDRIGQLENLDKFLEGNVTKFNQEEINRLQELGGSAQAMGILKMLDNANSDEDIIRSLMAEQDSFNTSGSPEGNPLMFINKRLNTMLKRFYDDFERGGKQVEYKNDQTGSYASGGKKPLDFGDSLRTELSKEYFLQRIADFNSNDEDTLESLVELIDSAGLSEKQETRMRRTAFKAYLDESTKFIVQDQNRTMSDPVNQVVTGLLEKYQSYFIDSEKDSRAETKVTQTFLNEVKDQFSQFSHRAESHEDIVEQHPDSTFVHMRKSTGPLDMLQALNESIQTNSLDPLKNISMDIWAQATAGRNDLKNVSMITMLPYFFMHRLGGDLGSIGLNFSNKSTADSLSLAKTIMFKRILPIGMAATYAEWGDDTYGAITGNRASATLINGLDNLDLFSRKLLDATGMGSFIDSQMDLNPMIQYWMGRDGYYDYDKERDYYVNGYDPVRKGRYWSFGSTNEFRGSQIQYFEPNLTRRLNSDYYNKSLYSGYWDKWSHSPLPTLTNPLSPLFLMADPYYLENEHKEDRPYPVSGTLFEKDTPWGIILNPTIGNIIKPVRKMNQDRLDGTGSDVLAIIYNINKQIQQKSLDNDMDNLIVLKDGKLTPTTFVGYDNPTMGENIISGHNPNFIVGDKSGYGKYSGGAPIDEYVHMLSRTSPGDIGPTDNDSTGLGVADTQSVMSTYHPLFRKVESTFSKFALAANLLFKAEEEIIDAGSNGSGSGTGMPGSSDVRANAIDVISRVNKGIYRIAQDRKDSGVLIPDKLSFNFSQIDNNISDDENIQNMIHGASGQDLLHEASVSFRLISGIYGYGMNRIAGFGENDGKQIADSGDMDSFARSFWDASLGGIGGGVSEIGRRFIPEFHRNARVNPLMNNLPDWLPDRFRSGDAYAAIPKGEARLPGAGYESLNHLHPDRYGTYGAFDRYKILADIAPYSAEFKAWQKIAKEQVHNPELQKEMRDIQKRVLEMGKAHDFYDYRFLGQSTDYETAIVTQVMNNGEFMIKGSQEVHRLAGVNFDEDHIKDSKNILSQFIHPGMEIQIATDSNEYHKRNFDRDTSINTAIFINGESVSQQLLDQKLVERKSGTQNAADTEAMHNGVGMLEGAAFEVLAHSDLPLLYDRWMRVRSPIESYSAEQVYGTPYKTWSDILGTFVAPARERAVSNHWEVVKSMAMFTAIMHAQEKEGIGLLNKKALSAAASLIDRGAFMGGLTAAFLNSGNGEWFKRGQTIGAVLTLVNNMYTSAQSSMFDSIMSFGEAGFMVGDILDDTKLLKKRENSILKNFVRNSQSLRYRGKSAVVGAAVGIAANEAFGPGLLSKDHGDEWKPDRVKAKWAMEDYFDRLNYIKYMGLYNKAARAAMDKENVDIDYLVEQSDKANKEVSELKQKLQELIVSAQSHNMSNDSENRRIVEYEKRIAQANNQIILKGGEYTRSALLYKQAAESTMYGLKDDAPWYDIVKALPKYERDYFTEFMKERDPEERDRILRLVSPFMRRALKQVWKEDFQKEKGPSNEEYFQHHNLPSFLWEGWDVNSDMNNIKAKTIKNEGLLFSDFGIYESQYRDQAVINAPNLRTKGTQDSLTLQANLQATLNGLGLFGTEVSVQPKSTSGIQSVINISRVVNYKIGQMVDNAFAL